MEEKVTCFTCPLADCVEPCPFGCDEEFYEDLDDYVLDIDVLKLREKRRKYYLKFRDAILAYHKAYYLENKEKKSAYMKKYRLENKEKINSCAKKYYLKFKDAVLARQKVYYLKNREKKLAYFKKYRLDHRDKMKFYFMPNNR